MDPVNPDVLFVGTDGPGTVYEQWPSRRRARLCGHGVGVRAVDDRGHHLA